MTQLVAYLKIIISRARRHELNPLIFSSIAAPSATDRQGGSGRGRRFRTPADIFFPEEEPIKGRRPLFQKTERNTIEPSRQHRGNRLQK